MSELKLDLPEPLKVNKSIARELNKLEKEGKPIFPWAPIQPIEMLFNLFFGQVLQPLYIAHSGPDLHHYYTFSPGAILLSLLTTSFKLITS
jgi:hypothetical protein